MVDLLLVPNCVAQTQKCGSFMGMDLVHIALLNLIHLQGTRFVFHSFDSIEVSVTFYFVM